ncbi:Rz-like lysis system protein LysB [Enterobacter sp. C2]|uniref:Rz-like lysis system protein LysB n=1 Tax=Enterobacter sp. C2 TaxID=2870346 RepID=UPI00256FD9E1|nr:Rz-like lysis system protein LysB [Enterobacter sp. C2]
MKALAALLVMAVLGLWWLYHESDNLRQSFEKANRVASEQAKVIDMLKNQLSVAVTKANKNEQAHAVLNQKLNAAGEQALRRENTITRLINENEQFRRWYSTDLPDAVRRVHVRNACASAGDCLQQLPESQPVPDAGQ